MNGGACVKVFYSSAPGGLLLRRRAADATHREMVCSQALDQAARAGEVSGTDRDKNGPAGGGQFIGDPFGPARIAVGDQPLAQNGRALEAAVDEDGKPL